MGLTEEEHERLVEHIFQNQSFAYESNVDAETYSACDSVVKSIDDNGTVNAEEKFSFADVIAQQPQETEQSTSPNQATTSQESDHQHSCDELSCAADLGDSKGSCGICLTTFKDNEKLVRGILCEHVFHIQCGMRWMMYRKDCPYCRIPFITMRQFRHAALDVLGSQRVADAKRRAAIPEDFAIVEDGV